MANEYNGALGWDDTITKDDEYVLLPEGKYMFCVTAIERARFEGSEKMSACPVANITMTVMNETTGEQGQIKDSLFLHTKAEWRLSQFFASIGLKKKGEPLVMNWNAVPGASGHCEIYINKYRTKDGKDGENNKVKTYLPADPAPQGFTPAPMPAMNGFAPAMNNGFTPGAF